jgi:excisionase family DNA binding protein
MDTILELAGMLRRAADLLERLPAELDERVVRLPDPDLRRLLSYSDAAIYLGCSERVMQRLAAEGEISKVRIGRRVLFAQEDLDDYVNRVRDFG